MLRMLRKLLQEYTRKSRIFLSWDAASWHMSKLLHAQIAEHNDAVIKGTVAGPLVELAPLPAGACRTGVPPPRPIVTFVNGRDGDICIWWTHPTLPLLGSSGPGQYHIDLPASALGADQPLRANRAQSSRRRIGRPSRPDRARPDADSSCIEPNIGRAALPSVIAVCVRFSLFDKI